MASQEHTGEHEVFDRIWAQTKLFYHDGSVKECRNFPQLWENVKFRRIDHFFPHTPQKSLEVGCGSGGVSLYLHNAYHYDVTLVDLSDEALTFARRNFELNARRPDWRATFEKADANQLPYEDESFDVVMSFGLLEHFTDIERPVSEQLRVLRKGGLFWADVVTRRFSVDTFSYIPGRVARAVRALARGDLRGVRSASAADFFENTYSLERYAATVEKLGGQVQHALGNRPFTSFGRLPLIAPALLAFYKSDLAQKWWRDFDFSNSRFSKFFGAGWWLIATK
jgi:ubiquinone/menaquinone biosynthesis C-methylase UbiE